ncbi:MAG: DUF111 family protein, partial [Desulfovibrio sp.]|nr:DUF111 family protein [Desulfovibrio sp.]
MDLFLDCTGGVDGQTVLAALAHLGMNFDSLEAVLAGSGMPCRVLVEPASGGMGMGCRIKVTMHGTSFPQDSMADLTGFMAALPLPEHTRSRVLAVMHSLQSAATSALGVTGESVLCDSHGACLCVLVPGICLGLEQLGVRRLTTSALPWPTEMPVSADAMPAPTAARLMQGKPVFRAKAAGAVVTPLGAALLDALADEFATGPEG